MTADIRVKPGQVYEPCGDQLARIRVVEYTPGSNRAYVVDAADGRFPRSILVRSLHSTGTTRTGKPRRTGYRLVQEAS